MSVYKRPLKNCFKTILTMSSGTRINGTIEQNRVQKSIPLICGNFIFEEKQCRSLKESQIS